MDIHIHLPPEVPDPRIDTVLAGISHLQTAVDAVLQKEAQLMATLADVEAQVTAETDVVKGVVTLLDTLKADLDAAIAANNPAAIQAVSDQIAAQSASLSAAVAKNTPAAPVA